MATIRMTSSTRVFLFQSRLYHCAEYRVRFRSSLTHPSLETLSWRRRLTVPFYWLPQLATYSTRSLASRNVARANVTAFTSSHLLVHLSSLPKRYQKRDDETEEDYALRVKELKLQDAHRHYQTVLLSASAPTQEEAGASSSPMTTTTTTAHQEKLCEAMQQLRQAYEDLMYWDKAVDVEEKLLQQYTMIMEANTNNDGNEEIRKKVATSLVKLGDLHVEMGHHFVEARRYYKQAMEIYLQLHQPPPSPLKKGGESSSNLSNPPMHADMGQVLHSVAMTYARQEEFDKATTILNQAKEHFVYHGLSLPMNDDDHDDDDDDGDEDEEERNDNTPKDHQVHPGVFQVLEDHAWILRLTDRYEMALSVYQEAYSYAKELKVEAKSEFWNDMEMNMADCQLALGKTEQALYTYQGLLDKAVAQRSKAMETNDADGNPNDDEEAMSLESVMRHNIGHIHAKEGRYQDALDEFTKAYKLKKQVSKSETNPELINTLHGLGASNATLGNYAEARNYFREALTIARIHADPTMGDDDPKVSYAMQNLEKVQKDRKPQAF